MTMQRRPLNGTTGLPVVIPAVPAAQPVVLHTLDGTAAARGGPFPNTVTVIVHNSTVGPVLVTVAVGGVPVFRTLAGGETFVVFDQQPMIAAAGAVPPANQITAGADVLGAVAWGWFGTQT